MLIIIIIISCVCVIIDGQQRAVVMSLPPPAVLPRVPLAAAIASNRALGNLVARRELHAEAMLTLGGGLRIKNCAMVRL